ncbi:MAG: alpha/beta hydrolase family protein [Anaeromyxobacteraceae bacterium]
MQLLDLVFGLWAGGPRFFADGWGDVAVYERLAPQMLAARKIPPARMTLGPARPSLGGLLAEGTFPSPERRLPKGSRTARVRLLLPRGKVRGVALYLAASGDQGFAVRLPFAAPLLEHGLGALVLENAFYGSRRPAAQHAHAVRSVRALGLMAAATLQEGRALLRWLHEVRGVERVGVTGYSMGGQLAAMVGAATPFPVAIVPIAASFSPDSVLREGVLRDVPDWTALGGRDVRERLLETVAPFSVGALPPPVEPRAAIVVGTAFDGVVPPQEMVKLAHHWRGSELRWLPAGHVSAVLRHQPAMREAVRDAFERLEQTAVGRGTDLRTRRGRPSATPSL